MMSEPGEETLLQAEHLFKRYGAKLAVNDLSLKVCRGMVLGFIGPNGAGKTTTMKMLSGILPAYSGTIRIGGADMETEPLNAKAKIGFLPENAPLYPAMTVSDFLQYVAVMRGIPRNQVREKVDLAIARCALETVVHEEIESLSKGYKRRVCLAQSILHEPEVLIMDEPTDGLDPNQKLQIRALIGELKQHSAIIISTHILEEVEAVCSQVFLIAGGRCLFDGPRSEFVECARGKGQNLAEYFAELTGVIPEVKR